MSSLTLNLPDTNQVLTPGDILHPALNQQHATYVDLNPEFNPKTSPAYLLTDSYAVLYGSIANLISCPVGGRSRIFQEDYYCGVMQFLQEPFGPVTATAIKLTLLQAISRWEPRIKNVNVIVEPDETIPGYLIQVEGDLVGLHNGAFSSSYVVSI